MRGGRRGGAWLESGCGGRIEGREGVGVNDREVTAVGIGLDPTLFARFAVAGVVGDCWRVFPDIRSTKTRKRGRERGEEGVLIAHTTTYKLS